MLYTKNKNLDSVAFNFSNKKKLLRKLCFDNREFVL